MNYQIIKKEHKAKRRIRIRAKIFGTPKRPRLSVFKSLTDTKAQIIDDEAGKTIVFASAADLKGEKMSKTKAAFAVGKIIAEKAIKKNINQVVFDRAGNKFHGRIKAVADGAKEGGLKI